MGARHVVANMWDCGKAQPLPSLGFLTRGQGGGGEGGKWGGGSPPLQGAACHRLSLALLGPAEWEGQRAPLPGGRPGVGTQG